SRLYRYATSSEPIFVAEIHIHNCEARQDEAENLVMAIIRSDDVHGPHILVTDTDTGERMHLIFSLLEILQLNNWSHDALRQGKEIGEDSVGWRAHQTHG